MSATNTYPVAFPLNPTTRTYPAFKQSPPKADPAPTPTLYHEPSSPSHTFPHIKISIPLHPMSPLPESPFLACPPPSLPHLPLHTHPNRLMFSHPVIHNANTPAPTASGDNPQSHPGRAHQHARKRARGTGGEEARIGKEDRRAAAPEGGDESRGGGGGEGEAMR